MGCMGCGLVIFLIILATGGSTQVAAKWGLAIWLGPVVIILGAVVIFLIVMIFFGGLSKIGDVFTRRKKKKWDNIR